MVMDPIILFVGFCVLAFLLTVIWAWVFLSTRHPIDYAQIERLRGRLEALPRQFLCKARR